MDKDIDTINLKLEALRDGYLVANARIIRLHKEQGWMWLALAVNSLIITIAIVLLAIN